MSKAFFKNFFLIIEVLKRFPGIQDTGEMQNADVRDTGEMQNASVQDMGKCFLIVHRFFQNLEHVYSL